MIIHAKTSVKRKRKKLTKAQEQQKKEYELLLDKWNNVPKFGRKYTEDPQFKKLQEKFAKEGLTVTGRSASKPNRQDLKPVEGKFVKGSTAPVKAGQYTGTKMLGISTMHKSNSVPIFSQEEAIDVAKMRRN